MLNTKSIRKALGAIVFLFGAVGQTSIVTAQDAETPLPPIGTETRAWTDLQVSNTAASPAARPLPGDIAEQMYGRYVESFARPIPDHLGRESFVEGSGGGGGQ